MSVVKNFSDLDLTKTYTYSDYLLWQFSERVELIKGFIRKMSPAPSRKHQTISYNLTLSIGKFFQNHPCSVFVAPFDVRLPIASSKKDNTVVQPDLCIICDENKLDDKGCNGAPDLIVEILGRCVSSIIIAIKHIISAITTSNKINHLLASCCCARFKIWARLVYQRAFIVSIK